MRRSTPCVGICSTTYGDLVCRGCKRFAHEIVGWNGFDADQRKVVWDRLQDLREGAVGHCLRVSNADTLVRRAELGKIPDRNQLSLLMLAYELLRTVQLPLAELGEIGIEAHAASQTAGWSRDLVRRIDQEFYARSLAHYEHNFKIAAQ